MRVIWSDASQDDRNAVFEYISSENEIAAINIDDRFDEETVLLRNFAYAGRIGRMRGTRELPVDGTPYILIYRIDGPEVTILRVLHGARQWP